MESRQVKQLSYIAFAAGVASVTASAAIYLLGRRKPGEGRRHAGVFVGLWAPTLFALAEMLDRMSVEDRSYLGIPIEHHLGERLPLGMR